MIDIAIARALHVLALVHWIGGVAFVTLVVLPLARSRAPSDGIAWFGAFERRFSSQVRVSIPVAGATGLWMMGRMGLWDRFLDPHFWWMSAMSGVWLVFMLIVFAVEPMFHERLTRKALKDPETALRRVAYAHVVLLALAMLAIFGAVAGTQGVDLF